MLYKVVHDIMIRAGVLASSYKFKVLSLDTRGFQYLIMMDLTNPPAGTTSSLTDIEAMMAQTAKARYGILVTAVYWRIITTGLSHGQPASNAKPAAHPEPAGPLFEPLQQEEVDAFKRALASASPAVSLQPGQSVTSGRRNPAPEDDFEDTQLLDKTAPASPLSITQYGDLN